MKRCSLLSEPTKKILFGSHTYFKSNNRVRDFLSHRKLKSFKKAIFLDLDGVILPSTTKLEELRCFHQDLTALQRQLSEINPIYGSIDRLYLGAAYYDWVQTSLNLIKQLCEVQDAGIVISSSWRKSLTFVELKHLFALHDLGEYVVGTTPVIGEELRGQEILQYLRFNSEILQFVIMDDNEFDICNFFSHAFVKCSDVIGVSQYNQATRILSNDCGMQKKLEDFEALNNHSLSYNKKSRPCLVIKFI